MDYILRAMELVKPGTPISEIKLLLIELYETEFRIYDHANGDLSDPLGLIKHLDIHDTIDGSIEDVIIDDYLALDIKGYFGYTLDEYLNLDRASTDLINKKAEQRKAAEKKPLADAEAELKKSLQN